MRAHVEGERAAGAVDHVKGLARRVGAALKQQQRVADGDGGGRAREEDHSEDEIA